MQTDSPDAEARVEKYRFIRSLSASGAVAQARARLDRYARALLRRAETAREVTSHGLRHIDRLTDLNEAGLLDYLGVRGGEPAFALSSHGRALLGGRGDRRLSRNA